MNYRIINRARWLLLLSFLADYSLAHMYVGKDSFNKIAYKSSRSHQVFTKPGWKYTFNFKITTSKKPSGIYLTNILGNPWISCSHTTKKSSIYKSPKAYINSSVNTDFIKCKKVYYITGTYSFTVNKFSKHSEFQDIIFHNKYPGTIYVQLSKTTMKKI